MRGKMRRLLSGYKLDDNEKDKTSQVKNIIVLFSHYVMRYKRKH